MDKWYSCNQHKSHSPEYIDNRVISNLDGNDKKENVGNEENEEDWEHRMIVLNFTWNSTRFLSGNKKRETNLPKCFAIRTSRKPENTIPSRNKLQNSEAISWFFCPYRLYETCQSFMRVIIIWLKSNIIYIIQ